MVTHFRKIYFDLDITQDKINKIKKPIEKNNNRIDFIIDGDKQQIEGIYIGDREYQKNFK